MIGDHTFGGMFARTMHLNPQFAKYLLGYRGVIWAMSCMNIRDPSLNPNLITSSILLSLLLLCDGAGAPLLRYSSAIVLSLFVVILVGLSKNTLKEYRSEVLLVDRCYRFFLQGFAVLLA